MLFMVGSFLQRPVVPVGCGGKVEGEGQGLWWRPGLPGNVVFGAVTTHVGRSH